MIFNFFTRIFTIAILFSCASEKLDTRLSAQHRSSSDKDTYKVLSDIDEAEHDDYADIPVSVAGGFN